MSYSWYKLTQEPHFQARKKKIKELKADIAQNGDQRLKYPIHFDTIKTKQQWLDKLREEQRKEVISVKLMDVPRSGSNI